MPILQNISPDQYNKQLSYETDFRHPVQTMLALKGRQLTNYPFPHVKNPIPATKWIRGHIYRSIETSPAEKLHYNYSDITN